MNPKTAALRSQPPRVRQRSTAPAYPVLLCATVAAMVSGCAYEVVGDLPADAQAQDASDAESYLAPDAEDAGSGDEVQAAGCSATTYHASMGVPGAAAMAALTVTARYRRRRRDS